MFHLPLSYLGLMVVDVKIYPKKGLAAKRYAVFLHIAKIFRKFNQFNHSMHITFFQVNFPVNTPKLSQLSTISKSHFCSYPHNCFSKAPVYDAGECFLGGNRIGLLSEVSLSRT